jgi:hypothetical protein
MYRSWLNRNYVSLFDVLDLKSDTITVEKFDECGYKYNEDNKKVYVKRLVKHGYNNNEEDRLDVVSTYKTFLMKTKLKTKSFQLSSKFHEDEERYSK